MLIWRDWYVDLKLEHKIWKDALKSQLRKSSLYKTKKKIIMSSAYKEWEGIWKCKVPLISSILPCSTNLEMFLLNTSTAMQNKSVERGYLCVTPVLHLKKPFNLPFTFIERVAEFRMVLIQEQTSRGSQNWLELSRNFHSRVSKAFEMSTLYMINIKKKKWTKINQW